MIAAAFAVAFAVLLSSTEAAIQTKNAEGEFVNITGTVGAENGDTVYVQHANTGGFTTFTITTIGSASASFAHSSASEDGQSITCGAATAATAEGACDVDVTDSGVTVALTIDDDSGAGTIFVNQKAITSGNNAAEATESIGVTVAQVPTSLSVKAKSSSIDAKGLNAAGATYVDIRLTDANNKGIALEAITIVSTRALLSTVSGDLDMRTLSVGSNEEEVTLTGFTGASLAGSVTTTADAGVDTDAGNAVDSSGYARVIVTGGGSPGVSTITVTAGELTTTTDIVLHGTVDSISAELEEGAIEVGGKTRIVVTALDAGDNPVANQNISVKTKGGVTPPEKLDIAVGTNGGVNKNGGNLQSLADKGDLPACDNVDPVLDAQDTDDVNEARPGSSGTNDDGQCVIEVSAKGGDTTTTTDDSARGTHTITIVASSTGADGPKGVNEVELDIEVGGSPATIETDAPARIDPSTELTINVTVVDDEGVRVGGVDIEVIQTDGPGAVITEIADRTKDGRAKFTYLASSRPDVVEFLVRTNAPNGAVTAKQAIIIEIGDEPVEVVVPPPAAPSLDRQPAVTGFTLVNFSGGSIGELATAVEEACGTGGRVYATDYLGRWVSYIPAAMMGPVNAAFEQLFPDGVPANEPLLVGGCSG